MSIPLGTLLEEINSLAPWNTAEDWDNVGLLVGNPARKISRILCAVEVTEEVVREARRRRADVILVHHPLIFRPVSRIRYDKYPGNLIHSLLTHDIALVAAHTNLDKSPHGTNFALAEMLDLGDITFLLPERPASRNYKVVVFVPIDYVEQVIAAIHAGGGAVIGDYSHCTFRSKGIGTFLPGEDSSPFIGKRGQLEEVEECRLESIVPRSAIIDVVQHVIEKHPYEEPAYDIYPLQEIYPDAGLGCVGNVKRPITLKTMATRVKSTLNPVSMKMVGDPGAKIRKVAVCTGAADSVISSATHHTADVFLVGEVNHHTAIAAESEGINLIIAGHYETEVHGIQRLGQVLGSSRALKENKVAIAFSRRQSSPFKSL